MFLAPFTRLSRTAVLGPLQHRSFASRDASSFPTVESCPAPTCSCAATPPLPDGLEIDRKSPLNGVITSYQEHVLVCTGKDNWPSRIEEDNSGDNLAADLKELLGRGGLYSDPFHHVSVLNSSFPPSVSQRRPDLQNSSVYLLPSFKYVPFLPRVSFDSVQALAKGYLLPETLHSAHRGLSPIHRDRLTRKSEYKSLLYGVKDVEDVMILVCGHGGRDMRCGVMGPVLRAEFEKTLPRAGVEVMTRPVAIGEGTEGEIKSVEAPVSRKAEAPKVRARIGLISHVGGHKFAGNVILYVPPAMRTATGERHPLAGCGIWYGRVEPRHVEGIVSETILQGHTIADLFRGGITPNREMVRL